MLSNVNSAMVSLIFLSAIYATAGCLLSDLAISWLYSHYPDELSSPHTLGKSTILRNVLLWLGGLICAYSTMVPSICHSLLPDAILSEILRHNAVVFYMLYEYYNIIKNICQVYF